MGTRVRLMGLVAVLGISSAVGATCVDPVAVACTDRGCPNGLIVEIDGEVTFPFTVTAVSSETGEPRVIECAEPMSCWLLFDDYAPQTVTLTYASEAEVVTQSVTPGWRVVYANGRRCGATCVQATVVLDLAPAGD